MSKELEPKLHPGRHGNEDDHLYKRTHSLDIRLSPVEFIALKESWNKTQFNSMAAYVRNTIFKGNEKKIDFYFEEKQQDRILAAKYLAELNKQGKNLNQIAKQLSSKSDFLKQEGKLLVEDLKKTLIAIQEIKDKLSSQKKI
jgi:phage terminase large subunit-like protein